MTKDEFVKICILCGYASKKNATKYANSKEMLTEEDFEKVFSINERQNDIKHGILTYKRPGKISGDSLINALGNEPKPWNHTFDASRGRGTKDKK